MANTAIYLLKYKNYYNRSAHRWDDIESYDPEVVDSMFYDFNPNDGIWATVIVNLQNDTDINKIDYLVVGDRSTVVSRWYVIEATRTRESQYRLKLLRDVVADYKDIIVNAPCFIEKATVNYGNPLLFNSEDMTFNQIKTSERLITDKSNMAWIVGYINKEVGATSISNATNRIYVAEYPTLNELPFYNRLDSSGNFNFLSEDSVSLNLRYGSALAYDNPPLFWTDFNQNGYLASGEAGVANNSRPFQIAYLDSTASGTAAADPAKGSGKIARECGAYYKSRQAEFLSQFYNISALGTPTELNNFLSTYSESGSLYKIGDKFYNVRVEFRGSQYLFVQSSGDLTTLFREMINNCSVLTIPAFASSIDQSCHVNCYANKYGLIVEEVSPPRETLTVEIPASTSRNHLQDAPYDMFCIPYPVGVGGRKFVACKATAGAETWEQYLIDPDAGMAIAQAITQTLGQQQLYDLQLLPYCPAPEALIEDGLNLITSSSSYREFGIDYSPILNAGTPVSAIVWCRSSEFSFTHRYSIDVTDPKIQAMCDFHRLVSPNYNGQFEFNAVKNEGVDFFNVTCTYKPYSPYIRVAPNFKGLYGGEYGDARGLICGGDFSLPTTTDQWKQYELNNKNYLNAFNRQIENMEFNNKYQRQSEVIQAVTGAVSTGVSTGMVAGSAGGPAVGLAAGLVAGGISAAAGAIDVSINDKLRTEALDYTKDQFGYTLGNIRALPYTLNRVSAFNANNKIFPILEYYTCTTTEKKALRDKIKYNGMTVMAIGTINDYLQEEETYIKGRIIRLDDLHEDYHIATAIAEEIYKGVFI